MSYCIYAGAECDCSNDAVKCSANKNCLVLLRRLGEVEHNGNITTEAK